jgi:hypothetical protein
MVKTLIALTVLLFAGCAEIKPKPTVFLEATVTEIIDCHNFRINWNGKPEAWIGCKLRLLTDRGWPRIQLTYQTFGENHYQIGQKVIISLENSESKKVLSITPKR